MKKILIPLLCALLIPALAGCGGSAEGGVDGGTAGQGVPVGIGGRAGSGRRSIS